MFIGLEPLTEILLNCLVDTSGILHKEDTDVCKP